MIKCGIIINEIHLLQCTINVLIV